MERAEHKVACQRRAHGEMRRLRVADFADHYDVRVLAQNGAQRAAEGQADFFVYLHLRDAVYRIFDWVFYSYDVFGRVVEHVQERVERRRFAGACRPGQQNDAVRRVYRLLQQLPLFRVEAEAFEARRAAALAQQTQDELFSEYRRQRRNADVYIRAGGFDEDASVLRAALLRYVHAGEYFYARGERRMKRGGYFRAADEPPVYPEADARALVRRLDMYVRGAFARGLV